MTISNLQAIKNEIDQMNLAEKRELIAYIAQKVQYESPIYAESKAIDRLGDIDNPDQWITTLNQGDEINDKALNDWLKKRGYQ